MSSHDSNSMGVEPEGLSIPTILGSMAVSAAVVVILVLIGMVYAGHKFQVAKVESTQTTGYPTMHETAIMGAAKLTRYGKADAGRYTIPIERAMELEALDASK